MRKVGVVSRRSRERLKRRVERKRRVGGAKLRNVGVRRRDGDGEECLD